MESIITQREKSLEQRAKAILGLAEKANINTEKLKKSFRRLAKENHPDKMPADKTLTYKFALIIQARAYLEGNRQNTNLLENDSLFESLVGCAPEQLKKSYGNWTIDYAVERGFYDFLGM